MNWTKFNTHGESEEKAFEIFVNQIFKVYCEKEFKDKMKKFIAINGAGGDGGIEAYAEINDGGVIGVQSKFFLESIGDTRIRQIKRSIDTAIEIRDNLKEYIVCVPRDLSNKRNGTKLSEREKIENLFLEYQHTGINFKLWGDYELQNFITTEPELAGVYKFCFENSEIDFCSIQDHFSIQKNSCLAEKYDERVHVVSNINREIERIIGDSHLKKSLAEKAKKIKRTYEDYMSMLNKFYIVSDKKDKQLISNVIDRQKVTINQCVEYMKKIEECCIDERATVPRAPERLSVDTDWFESIKDRYLMSSHYARLRECIKKVKNTEVYAVSREFNLQYEKKNLIVEGDLGTGKTHSVVNQIDCELKKNNVAFYIRATDVSKNMTWREIFVKELGLSSQWSEEDIFCSLNCLADKNNYIEKASQDITILKKVFICFDGIDEHNDYSFWYEKQLQAQELCKKYNNLRFCFVGRKYAFENTENLDTYRIFRFDSYPGYDIQEICLKYFKKYNVTCDEKKICSYLNTPLEIKLFCEENKGRKIKSLNNIQINLPQLFAGKFKRLDFDFIKNKENIVCLSPISRAARVIGEHLYDEEKIDKKKMFELINNDVELCLFDSNQKNEIVSYLKKLGLINSRILEEDFGIKTEEYHKGMQPVIDYVLAKKMSDDIKKEQFDNIRVKIKNNEAIVKLCALIIFEEKSEFLKDIKNLKLSKNVLTEATIYTILHANPGKIESIVEDFEKYIKENPYNMKEILVRIIIPCSRIIGHPLGAEFLDNILNKYTNMADRDKIWSLPDEILDENNYNGVDDSIIALNEDDKYNGLPLIYAWLLTGTNNYKLYKYRSELMKWALLCPNQYILLLKKIGNSNDVQQMEQLYGIAMCLCYKNRDNIITSEIVKIIDSTFFYEDKINTYDIQLRFYIRAIAEKASSEGLMDNENLKKYQPPYKCDKTISLNKDAAINGSRMGGYKGIISYDLARYVLCDHIENRCFSQSYDFDEVSEKIKLEDVFSEQELMVYKDDMKNNEEYNGAIESYHNKKKNLDVNELIDWKQSDELISKNQNKNNKENRIKRFFKQEADEVKISNLNEDSFIIGSAFQYVLDCGWSEEKMARIDSAIQSVEYPADHGNKSEIMSFIEKYIWCFRSHIMGFLADKFRNNQNYVDNYIELDNILMPISEYEQSYKGIDEIDRKFLPQNIFDGVEIKRDRDIITWIKSKDIPIDVNKWINIDNTYLMLNGYYCMVNEKYDLECTMWITSAIIKSKEFRFFKDNLYCNQQRLYSIIENPNEFNETTDTDGSRSPFEIINFGWNKVYDSEFQNISLLNNRVNRYKLYKTTESAYNVHTKFVEIHYKIPSKKVRKMLNINDNQGFAYKDNDKVMSIYEANNKSWENHKNVLVVDKEEFERKLKENSEKLIWFIRIDKELSLLGRDRYKDINEIGSVLMVCWYERGNLIIKNIEGAVKKVQTKNEI